MPAPIWDDHRRLASSNRRELTSLNRGVPALADLERTFFVMARADAAFDVLSDPVRLPDYVPTVRLEESTAIEGEADADADLDERQGAPDAGFVADRKTRTITWGRPDRDYGGSIEIRESTASTSDVIVRLHTRPDADAEAVGRMFDQAVSSMRRLLTGLR